jgi:2,4-dienoyl-CoA reductase (NADPH2)
VLAAGAAHTKFELPGSEGGATGRKLIKTERLHSQLKLALKFFSAAQLESLTHLWMPVKKSAVIMGGTLHGCELAEFLVKRGRQVTVVHNGPESELGEGMGRDDLENLWPWFKMKRVPIWTDVKYHSIVKRGLEVQTSSRRLFVLEGKNIMTTQDWGPNTAIAQELGGLVSETHIIGSCREPGWIVDAIREGALVGYAI